MAKVTFILGLAGSGKTFHAEPLREATGAEVFEGVEHHKSLPMIVQRLMNQYWQGVYTCPDGVKIRPITRIDQSKPLPNHVVERTP